MPVSYGFCLSVHLPLSAQPSPYERQGKQTKGWSRDGGGLTPILLFLCCSHSGLAPIPASFPSLSSHQHNVSLSLQLSTHSPLVLPDVHPSRQKKGERTDAPSALQQLLLLWYSVPEWPCSLSSMFSTYRRICLSIHLPFYPTFTPADKSSSNRRTFIPTTILLLCYCAAGWPRTLSCLFFFLPVTPSSPGGQKFPPRFSH